MLEVSVQCSTCFEWVEIVVDRDERGVLVQDCDVCCRPIEVTVQWSASGELEVRVLPSS
jgi:hypothetical protein